MGRNLERHEQVQISYIIRANACMACMKCGAALPWSRAYRAVRSKLCATCNKWYGPVQGGEPSSTAHTKARY